MQYDASQVSYRKCNGGLDTPQKVPTSFCPFVFSVMTGIYLSIIDIDVISRYMRSVFFSFLFSIVGWSGVECSEQEKL